MSIPSARYRAWKEGKRASASRQPVEDAKRHPNADPHFHIPRCQAQTKSGEQCKHEATRGDFCALHRNAT